MPDVVTAAGHVAYVLKGFPRLSEVFIPELVRNGENGLLVESVRPVDLVDPLHRLVMKRFDAGTTAARMASLFTGAGGPA
jgi:hypothetical protein